MTNKKEANPQLKTPTLLLLLLAPLVCFASSMDQAHNLNVRVEVLIKAFKENEVAANAKYNGVAATVGGTVAKVGIDKDGDPYILSSGHGCQRRLRRQYRFGSLQVCRLLQSESFPTEGWFFH